MEQESGRVDWVIIGIGVNVNQPCFEAELSEKAVSLKMLVGESGCRADVIAGILNRFEDYYPDGIHARRKEMIENYQKRLSSVGEKRKIRSGGVVYEGVIVGVDETGRLIVELPDQSRITVVSGEMIVSE